MMAIDCKVAQPGFAAGYAFLCRKKSTYQDGKGTNTQQVEDLANTEKKPEEPARLKDSIYTAKTPEEEAARLIDAVKILSSRFEAQKRKVDPAQAELIEAQILMLNDEDLTGYACTLVREGKRNAPDALREAQTLLCARLEESGNVLIAERCEDIRGLTAGLIDIITGNERDLPTTRCILAGEELSPSDISMVDPDLISGILTEAGSPTSHVSVLAGNLGVPYLYGAESLADKVQDGDFLILDADNGRLIINPSDDLREEALKRQADADLARREAKELAYSCITRTKIYANIGKVEEAAQLPKTAEGIGLVRTEFLFLQQGSEPSEEEQYQAYRQVAEIMQDREAVFRTMDIGSDKKPAWLPMKEELNPALGERGLRVSLSCRGLFRTQLRALLRAAACGNVKVMVPMVASLWEVEEVKAEMKAAAEELEREHIPYRIPDLGVMIETPAAVMIAPELASQVSFFSIGTNDLTQYTLALDREAQGLDEYYAPLHEAVFRMIGLVVEAAHAHHIPAAICGEMGGMPGAMERLIRLGVDELSVSPAKLAQVKKAAAEIEEKLDAEEEWGAAAGERNAAAEQRNVVTDERSAAAENPSAERHGSSADIKAPVDGELIPMEEIPDPVFSGGMMGECLGIMPSDGKIYAPISGTITTVAKARHAISFQSGTEEILVHVGLDTVKLNGEGFNVLVKEGDTVSQGQLVMEADLAYIRAQGFNPMVIIARTQ